MASMVVALLASFVIAGPAASQDFMNMVDAYGQAHVNMLHGQIMSDATKRRGESARRTQPASRPAPTTAHRAPQAVSNPRALRFVPSAAVTRSTNARLVETLSGAMAQGRTSDEFRRLLDGGELQRSFRELIGKYGFSDRDLADVIAGHLVMSWQVVNDVSELDERRGNVALRDGLRDALAKADWVRALDDAQKQTLAETLVVGTMLNVTRYIHGKQTGDTRLASAAMQDADAMVRGLAGIDLRQVRFTSRGFERR
ncbi:MAG: hypothetical protein NVV60_13495 [Luteimonas sp.]|nr:hypothetical protein [Luteimonas sp.]